MMDDTLAALLAGNQVHVDELGSGALAKVVDGQEPRVVSMCCSDSRVSQEGMFDVGEPGWLFTASRIGNQAADRVEGERVVDGSLLYPIQHAGTRTAVIVGHTGCGAVTAAYEAIQGSQGALSPGIAKEVGLLVPVLEAALGRNAVDVDGPDAMVVDRLVEANVHAQVEFLLDRPEVPDEVAVYGFVYDLRGSYGGPRGRAYLVNANGERGLDTLRGLVPAGAKEHVASLLA